MHNQSLKELTVVEHLYINYTTLTLSSPSISRSFTITSPSARILRLGGSCFFCLLSERKIVILSGPSDSAIALNSSFSLDMPNTSLQTSKRGLYDESLPTTNGLRCSHGRVSWLNPQSLCSSSLSSPSLARSEMSFSLPTARTTPFDSSRLIEPTSRLMDESSLTMASSSPSVHGQRRSSSPSRVSLSGPSVPDSHRVVHVTSPFVLTYYS